MAFFTASRRRWKPILIGSAIVFAGLALLSPTLLDRLTRVKTPAVRLPQPNGYNDLIRAGASVVGQPPRQGQVWDADATELHAYVDPNPEALQLVQLALSRESMVPLQYTDGFLASHLGDMTALRDGARVLAAEGFLAEKEGRIDDAVDRFVDLIRLGQAAARGGLLIDELIGLSQERLGVLGLSRVRSKLSSKACRDLLKRLAKLDAGRGSLDEFIHRDRLYARATAGWGQRALMTVHPKPFEDLSQPVYDASRRAQNTVVSRQRLLMLDLAIRAFRLERGGNACPKTLDELVPEYFERLPIDPFRPNGGFIYKVLSNNDFLLYSVGPDGDDDGGAPLPESAKKAKNRDDGDLRVDPS